MAKGKMIPLIIAGILLILAVFFFIRILRNNVSFDKLIVSYNDNNEEYEKLSIDNVIVVNNTSFWIVSIEKNKIVLNASDEVTINNETVNEVSVELNKNSEVCFASNNCAIFKLQ